jgi:poly(hydroxyalkanoate) depolymerase family esterase
MNDTFQRLMAEATRLTRAGHLGRATAAIQAALAGAACAGEQATAAPVATDAAQVIDVDAVEVVEVDTLHVVDLDAPLGEPPVIHPATPADRAFASADDGFISGIHHERAGKRAYKLYVPPGHRGRRMPLVVMLHGCTQGPDDFAAGTRMNDAARDQGFLVLYPAQDQHANASRCWNWFKHNHQERGRGEPHLIAGMTRHVIERYGVDAERVYVAGLSAGGAMAAILGEAYPDLFAAVGVHSGLPAKSAADLPGALKAMKEGAPAGGTRAGPPTIVFHGDRDTTVHPVNGERIAASRHGHATPESETALSANGRRYTRVSYRDGSGRVVTEHWVVHGGAHAWSGGDPRGSYTDAKGPDATTEMLRFFFAHSNRPQGDR